MTDSIAAEGATFCRRHSTALLMFALLLFNGLTLGAWYRIDQRPPRWDESHYLYMSEHSFQQLRSFHFINALNLHGVTDTKAGLVPFVTALSYFVVGHSSVLAAFLANLGSLLLLGYALIALSGVVLKTWAPGFVACLLFQTIPIVILWSGYYQVDLPLTALVAFTVMLCARIDRDGFASRRDGFGSRLDALLLGASIGFGMGVKHLYPAFVGLPILYLLIRLISVGPGFKQAVVKGRSVLLAIAGGVLFGVLYHILNIHVVIEQLARSRNAALTGGTGPAPTMWPTLRSMLAPYFFYYLATAMVGLGFIVTLGRGLAIYPFLWLVGGWVGIGVAASFPEGYYFVPILPALTFFCAGILSFDQVMSRPNPAISGLTTGLSAFIAAGLMVLNFQMHIGIDDPKKFFPGLRYLIESRERIAVNPFVTRVYWEPGIVDGNVGLLPYPNDWKTDDMIAGLRELAVDQNGRVRVTCRLLADYEWFNWELFRYKMLQSGLNEMTVVPADYRHLKLPEEAIAGVNAILVKSGQLLKDTLAPGAMDSQKVVDILLANDGAWLTQHGFTLFRSFPLPDASVATIWIRREQLYSRLLN